MVGQITPCQNRAMNGGMQGFDPAIEDFGAMAAMPGLDVFFIGPTDLSIALGVPHATFDEPKMAAALEKAPG